MLVLVEKLGKMEGLISYIDSTSIHSYNSNFQEIQDLVFSCIDKYKILRFSFFF